MTKKPLQRTTLQGLFFQAKRLPCSLFAADPHVIAFEFIRVQVVGLACGFSRTRQDLEANLEVHKRLGDFAQDIDIAFRVGCTVLD